MRSARHLAALALALLAAAALSSCVVPLSSSNDNCASYCALLQGCGVTGAPTGDCNTWCAAFATELDHVGCKAQFDDATSCVVGDGTCQAANCDAETAAFSQCTQQFCQMNPTDSACQTGG